MKFIHIADTHLGFVPDAGQTWNRRSEKDLWDSLSEVFQVAENEKIDIILIAGDLFHRQPLMRELKEFNYILIIRKEKKKEKKKNFLINSKQRVSYSNLYWTLL